MKLFKVRIIDPAINKKQLVTVYVVIAPSAATAEQRCAAENPSAFSKQPKVEVEVWEHDSVKLLSMMLPVRKEKRQATGWTLEPKAQALVNKAQDSGHFSTGGAAQWSEIYAHSSVSKQDEMRAALLRAMNKR